MYEELIKSLRKHADPFNWNCSTCMFHDAENRGFCTCTEELAAKAVDCIDKLVEICNSLLLKYEEEAESMIWEYSGHINEDLDKLHKEIEDYKARINGVAEPPKEET